MCDACSLFALVTAKRISEMRKAVVRVDQLTVLEQARLRGLLSDAGYRFERGTIMGKPALRIWALDWN